MWRIWFLFYFFFFCLHHNYRDKSIHKTFNPKRIHFCRTQRLQKLPRLRWGNKTFPRGAFLWCSVQPHRFTWAGIINTHSFISHWCRWCLCDDMRLSEEDRSNTDNVVWPYSQEAVTVWSICLFKRPKPKETDHRLQRFWFAPEYKKLITINKKK